MKNSDRRSAFPLRDFDLAGTLDGGQTFRWRETGGSWEGVIGTRWVRLTPDGETLHAETATPTAGWAWLTDYLQLHVDLPAILATFPNDRPMQAAIAGCPGLRLLRQEPWECLASFILSSSKQIVQIQQCVALLAEQFGTRIPALTGEVFAFPDLFQLAEATEPELRACKLGFRAPYLHGTARLLAAGQIDLADLHGLPTQEARTELMKLPGVGRKIADCVLLFAFGRQDAFPVDVWILKALGALYFPGRRPTPQRLLNFTATHFGPNAGYAQQYLFHYARTKLPELRTRKRR
jgi:N-glycosylase/DNA lyase